MAQSNYTDLSLKNKEEVPNTPSVKESGRQDNTPHEDADNPPNKANDQHRRHKDLGTSDGKADGQQQPDTDE